MAYSTEGRLPFLSRHHNNAMHWGQGMFAAGIRGAMGYYGIVGPFGSYLFMGMRLLIDQTLEQGSQSLQLQRCATVFPRLLHNSSNSCATSPAFTD
jgi:hypothetical protein